MKTNTLLHTLLCLFFMGLAMQPGRAEEPVEPHVYLPLFGENETSYNIFIGYFDAEHTDSLYYTGEREIDGKIYKVFNSKYGDGGLLRVTEDNAKAYCLDNYSNEEVLNFDLSLEKGEHFTYYHTLGAVDCTVDSVYWDEKGRKNLILLSSNNDWPPVYLKFIEGEGSSAGLFHAYYAIFHLLLCSQKDGEQSYFYYDDCWDIFERYEDDFLLSRLFYEEPSCNFSWVGIDDTSVPDDWLVFPSLFEGTFYVKHDVEIIKTLSVYDSAGKLLLRKEINDTNAQIDLSAPAGTYHVSIITESGNRCHKKIAKL